MAAYRYAVGSGITVKSSVPLVGAGCPARLAFHSTVRPDGLIVFGYIVFGNVVVHDNVKHDNSANRRQQIDGITLGDLLDRRANEYPDREALVFPDATVSYAELRARADMVARGLLVLDVLAGETIGILLPNCRDSIAVLFGAMKVGAVPVPVSTRFKDCELSELVAHSQMRLIFTDPSLFHALTATRMAVPTLRQIVLLDTNE